MRRTIPIEDRIKDKTTITENGCHVWTGATTRGYPVIGRGRRGEGIDYVSRVLMNPPPGKIVMHKCDNPLCVNREHLIIGTYSENTSDAWSRLPRAKRYSVRRIIRR
jgi:HNH endonuclease